MVLTSVKQASARPMQTPRPAERVDFLTNYLLICQTAHNPHSRLEFPASVTTAGRRWANRNPSMRQEVFPLCYSNGDYG